MTDEPEDRELQQAFGQQTQQPEFAQQGQQSQAERQQSGQEPFSSPQASDNDQPLGESSGGSGQVLGTNGDAGTATTLSEGFESSETLTQSGSSQDSIGQNAGGGSNFSDTDRQGSGFIGAQGSGSDDYLQESQNPELAQEDSLNQQDDDGMGTAGSEQDS
jgi:hypothetical protein